MAKFLVQSIVPKSTAEEDRVESFIVNACCAYHAAAAMLSIVAPDLDKHIIKAAAGLGLRDYYYYIQPEGTIYHSVSFKVHLLDGLRELASRIQSHE